MLRLLFVLWLCQTPSAIPAKTQTIPEIRVSLVRVKSGESIMMTGTGFTPNHTAVSHLLKPDGAEYNPLRVRADEHGELAHRIDTTMLELGTFELWVEDEAAKSVSNKVRFTVEEPTQTPSPFPQ
jgi:hypothetical protein